MSRYVERRHDHIHAALSIWRSAPRLLPHKPPARRADLRMLVALTHLRQLPSLQLHGELAARAGAGQSPPMAPTLLPGSFLPAAPPTPVPHHGWPEPSFTLQTLALCLLLSSICVSWVSSPCLNRPCPCDTELLHCLLPLRHICSSCPRASPKPPPTVRQLNPAVCGTASDLISVMR